MAKRKIEEDLEDGKMMKEENLALGTSKKEFEDLEMKYEADCSVEISKTATNCEDGIMREELNCSPRRSDDTSISRIQMYEEAYQEIRQCQEAIRMARHKIEKLNDDLKDFMCMEGILCIDEANIQMEEAINCLKESSKHWVSFLVIPEVPMRHILKYLKFEDKAKFRLSSKSHRNVVDWYDDDFKSVKINVSGNLSDQDIPRALATDKDIKLSCFPERYLNCSYDFECDHEVEDGVEQLGDFSDRIVEVRGCLEAMKYVRSGDKVEKIRLRRLDLFPFPKINFGSFASSLKVLQLQYLDLSSLVIHQSFSLPHLEKLLLSGVTGLSGTIQLLASSSSSLQYFSLNFINEDDWDFTRLKQSGIVMTRLKEIEMIASKDMNGIFGLLESASNSLKKLELYNVHGIYQEIPDEINLSLPHLERLYLGKCNSEYLSSILSCPAPRLHTVILKDMNLDFPADIRFNPVTRINKLALCDVEGFSKVLTPATDDVQQLDLLCGNLAACGYDDVHGPFPKLKKLFLKDCGAALTVAVLSQCPDLQELELINSGDMLAGDLDRLDLRGVEKLTLRKMTEPSFGPLDASTLLSKAADSLTQISIYKMDLPTFQVEQLILTKLSMVSSSCSPGLCNLLNACRSTLEELEIYESFSKQPLSLQGLQEMENLKEITIQFHCETHYKNVTRPDGLNELLRQSRKSLEKLVLDFPSKLDSRTMQVDSYYVAQVNRHLLTLDLSLPNLKILQVHPKPADTVVRQISRRLSREVTLWLFPRQKSVFPKVTSENVHYFM